MTIPAKWIRLQHLTMFYTSNCLYFSGFAFVYFEEERDAEDSIRSLDNMPFGYDRRRLSVEWARVVLSPPSVPSFWVYAF